MNEQQIQTEVKDKVIIFKDRSRRFITNKQEERLLEESARPGSKGIRIDGQYVHFDSFYKIMDINDFYKEYPDERPVPVYKEVLAPIKPWTKDKRINAIEKMIAGFKSCFINREMTENSREVYRKMLKTLREAEISTKTIQQPITSVGEII